MMRVASCSIRNLTVSVTIIGRQSDCLVILRSNIGVIINKEFHHLTTQGRP